MTRSTRPGRLAAVAVVAALVLGVTACGGSSKGTTASGGKSAESVKLAILAPSSLLWLHAIAEDRDLYAKHGVAVEEIQVQNSSALAQAVSTGSADAGIALGDNVMRAIDQGGKLVISGAVLGKAALRLYAAKGVPDVAAMKGGKVTAGAVEGGTADLLIYQIVNKGLSKDDVALVAIPNSKDRVVALGNGQVKGALLIPPFDTLAEKAGATFIDWYDKPYVETPLVLNTDWAKSHENAAKGITQALAEAAGWIYAPENKDKAVAILSKYTSADADSAAKAYAFMVTDGQVISRDLTVPEGGLDNIVQVSAAVSGTTAQPVDESKYYDDSYLKD